MAKSIIEPLTPFNSKSPNLLNLMHDLVKKSFCQKVILSFLRVFLLQRGSGIINSEHSVCSVFGNYNKKNRCPS